MWYNFKETNMSVEYFKISSGLKTLIGKDLITDQYVAIFELVKNAYDASATRVDIEFLNFDKPGEELIIIRDNGKGMSESDIRNKWLFVAYSAKRDNTEDNDDYRNKLSVSRNYAGAKGVGRFSCDRLGRNLKLITVKNNQKAILYVNWLGFDENLKIEFDKIGVNLDIVEGHFRESGTILEISGIEPNEWDQESFKKLRQRLSKLIHPDQNYGNDSFQIVLNVPHLLEYDQNVKAADRINGNIDNFIFEKLNIKTTRIKASIGTQGQYLETTLYDRNEFIYKLKEKNPFPFLQNIELELFFLNRSAKVIFKKNVGVEPVEFGSIMIYKNGFRVYPYGERGDDSLGIDNRAVQGYNRYLGLRNLIGHIKIGPENKNLKEATSRDAGFIKSSEYYDLLDIKGDTKSILYRTIRRLEKYVVEVTKWGINQDEYIVTENKESKSRLASAIIAEIDSSNTYEIELSKNISKIIESEKKNTSNILKDFQHKVLLTENAELLDLSIEIEKAVLLSKLTLQETTKQLEQKETELFNTKHELRKNKEQLSIVTSIASADIDLIVMLHHEVLIAADIIQTSITNLLDDINTKNSRIEIPEIKNKLEGMMYQTTKIVSCSTFGSKKIFPDLDSNDPKYIMQFTQEYIQKITPSTSSYGLTITVLGKDFTDQKILFKPLDLSIIIDNFVSNSKKAKATKLDIVFSSVSGFVKIDFIDNGHGISKFDSDKIFFKGFSTTKSTGLGLFYVQQSLEEMKGLIEHNSHLQTGFSISIKLPIYES